MDTDATRDLDAPPVNGLESIFVLPEYLQADERVAGWYDEMTRQLLAEAQGMPMKAAQYTLMERVAYLYAKMRYEELQGLEVNERQRQATQDAWQKAIDQFNRLLEKHNDKLMNEMLVKVQDILQERLKIITDPTEKAALRRALGEDFAKIGL